jgi:hypothetical protein
LAKVWKYCRELHGRFENGGLAAMPLKEKGLISCKSLRISDGDFAWTIGLPLMNLTSYRSWESWYSPRLNAKLGINQNTGLTENCIEAVLTVFCKLY